MPKNKATSSLHDGNVSKRKKKSATVIAPTLADTVGKGNKLERVAEAPDREIEMIEERSREKISDVNVKNNSEFYLEDEYAQDRNTDEFYAKDGDGNELYALDTRGEKKYATKKIQKDGKEHRVEFPAIKQGRPEYIVKNDSIQYPRNTTTGEPIPATPEGLYPSGEYPKNESGDEYYLFDAMANQVTLGHYAKDASGNEIYPKRNDNDEYIIGNTYAKTHEQDEIYPKLEDGNEYYHNAMYAKKKNRDEFYATHFLAGEKDSEQPIAYTYARDKEGNEFYPKNFRTNDEYYILADESGDCQKGAKKKVNGKMKFFYARKKNDDEFYPKKTV